MPGLHINDHMAEAPQQPLNARTNLVGIAVDTLNTLGSLFSSILPYCVARDSGT